MRELTKKEQVALERLHKAMDNWPDTLEVFADNSTMCIIDTKTHLVIDDNFPSVYCDGGDPDHDYEENGDTYINKPQ
jgi:hypothetical protein